jgi:hypothetical protein
MSGCHGHQESSRDRVAACCCSSRAPRAVRADARGTALQHRGRERAGQILLSGADQGHALQHGGSSRRERQISLDLKQVTVPEVLEMTRELYGYDYRKLPAGYLVLPATLQTRMFYLNYVDMERTGSSRTRVTSGQSAQTTARTMGRTARRTVRRTATTRWPTFQGGQNQSVSSGSANRNIGGSQTGTRHRHPLQGELLAGLEQSLQEMLPKDPRTASSSMPRRASSRCAPCPSELNDVAKFLAKIQSTSWAAGDPRGEDHRGRPEQ